MIIAQTERLVLRTIAPKDLSDLVSYLNEWEVTKWLVMEPFPYTEQDGQDFIAAMQEKDAEGAGEFLVIASRETNALMGGIRFPSLIEDSVPHPREREIGYWLAKPFWSAGYMTESVTAALSYVFSSTDALRLVTYTNPVNDPSQNVLKKVGFRYIGLQPRTKPGLLRGSTTVAFWELLRENYRHQHPA